MTVSPAAAQVIAAAPELPPGRREALIVATASYDDQAFRQLRAPARDAEDLAEVLADPEIGGFTITRMIDQPEAQIRRGIAAFLDGRKRDDTVLVYLSCHGIQDSRGRLYFAATDTIKIRPQASAVKAAELLDELDECRARRQILILDCCFSGSFDDRAKGEDDLQRALAGHSRGREVLTASRAFEYSYEGEPLDNVLAGSVFTTGLVLGLRTGAADHDGDGLIGVDEAYEYAYRHVQETSAEQTPQHWLTGGEGQKIVLARNPVGRAVVPVPLPDHVTASLDSGSPHIRIGAVNEIAEWLDDPDPARFLAASRALQDVVDNDSPRVAKIARAHLDRVPSGPEAEPSSPPSTRPRRAREPESGGGRPWIPQALAATLEGAGDLGMAIGPDGTLLATGSRDQTVQVWDPATGTRLRNLRGHSEGVATVAFSPDGTLLVSGSYDRTVRVWNPATGECLRTLEGHTGSVMGVAFSPDGALLASGGDRTVRVWNPATGKCLRILEGHTGSVMGVAFGPDGALLASGGGDKAVRVWNPATGERLRTLQGHTGSVMALAFGPDQTLASGGDDKAVRVWNPATGKRLRTLEDHTGLILGVAFSPDGALLASSGSDRMVRVWDPATGEQLGVLIGHTSMVNAVAFSPVGTLLASVSNDGTARLWR